jgi:hypothetical protein
MHMHATTGEGMRQNGLIRKVTFVVQCRREAGLTEIFA